MNKDESLELGIFKNYESNSKTNWQDNKEHHFDIVLKEAETEFLFENFEKKEQKTDTYLPFAPPIIKLVNNIFIDAIEKSASDIHIEAQENFLSLKYRIDGFLHEVRKMPKTIKNAIVSRLKILAKLDITEKRKSQDGKIKLKFENNKKIDLRISCIPTVWGESIVLRILNKQDEEMNIENLGFDDEELKLLKKHIKKQNGLILVTGPTGSGKSTTLYSILKFLSNKHTKILTAEDPVEYNLEDVNQLNINEEIGFSFQDALKSFLRHDPDIIMIGEIRDEKTAQIAVRAALTGHLVLSTLHTNDCSSTILRLLDMGIAPYLLASCLSLVVSQRLIRKLCPFCKRQVKEKDIALLKDAGLCDSEIANLDIFEKGACPKCNNLGYLGRVGIFEIMEVKEEILDAINSKLDETSLRKIATEKNIKFLRQAALNKVREKITSIDEALKHTELYKETILDYILNPDMEIFEDGEFIIRENNNDSDFFMLISGKVNVLKGEKIIARIVEPYEYFGELSALTKTKRQTSIIADGRVRIKRFSGDKIFEIIKNQKDLSVKLFEILAKRLNEANLKLSQIMGKNG